MFGSKQESAQQAMAREMRERSDLMRQGAPLQGGSMPKGVCRACVFAVGFIIATGALAALNLKGARELALRLPEQLSFTPHLGDKTQDAVALAALQALALCAAAAILPITARIWIRLRDQTHANLYITIWGTSVALPFAYFFIKDFFGPLVLDVFSLFT